MLLVVTIPMRLSIEHHLEQVKIHPFMKLRGIESKVKFTRRVEQQQLVSSSQKHVISLYLRI